MRRLALPAALLLACVPGAAWAAAKQASCTVSATPVAFGTFNPFGSTVTSTGTITVACSSGSKSATYTIALNAGNSGSFAQRQTSTTSPYVKYNLYTTSGYTSIWGDGTGGSVTVTGTDTTITSNFTVYGQLPTPQGVTPNTYSDSITVTVTY